jgi:hypothetical protein
MITTEALVRKVAQLGTAWLVPILCYCAGNDAAILALLRGTDRLVVAAREQIEAFSQRLGRLADDRVPLRGTA